MAPLGHLGLLHNGDHADRLRVAAVQRRGLLLHVRSVMCLYRPFCLDLRRLLRGQFEGAPFLTAHFLLRARLTFDSQVGLELALLELIQLLVVWLHSVDLVK